MTKSAAERSVRIARRLGRPADPAADELTEATLEELAERRRHKKRTQQAYEHRESDSDPNRADDRAEASNAVYDDSDSGGR